MLAFVSEKVHNWISNVKLFADIASMHPAVTGLGYAAFTRSLQHEWTFLLRGVSQCYSVFQDLKYYVIRATFLPAIIGVEISSNERPVCSSLAMRTLSYSLYCDGTLVCK